jgi:hypothetical protein
MTTFLIPLLVKFGVPEKMLKPVQWAIFALAIVLAFLAAKAIYDASVVDDYEKDRAVESIDARDDAAEQRAKDTIKNTVNEKDRNDAINAAPTTGTLSPAARALACERLRQRGGELPPGC